MKFIQTYFSNYECGNILSLNSKFHSSEINWLSIAYSCLLLKQQHHDIPLHLYGNEAIIELLINKFELPYDQGIIIDSIPENRKKYYCWPKIEVYKLQNEPFIHIDNDIFIWEPLPDRLLSASLVAQHKENDSTFYMRILNHLREFNIKLPDVIEKYITDTYILSYNAGLIGGNNVEFFKNYINNIEAFLDSNQSILDNIPQVFLLNVVFEQWMYYALTTEKKEAVETYYLETVVDFLLCGTREPLLAVNGRASKYLHLMDYKRQYSCNRLIVRNMLNEFPVYYNKILSICSGSGLKTAVKYYNGINNNTEAIDKNRVFNRSLSYAEANLSYESAIFDELRAMENKNYNLLMNSRQTFSTIFDNQDAQKIILDKIADNSIKMENCIIKISPYVEIWSVKEELVHIILPQKELERNPQNMQIVFVYNAIFDKTDEFIYANIDSKILTMFHDEVLISELFGKVKSTEMKEKIIRFVKQGIFDNILYCKLV